jgi:DNA-binding NarL/FixJ family response regulator
MSPDRITLLLVDRPPALRRALRTCLALEPDLLLVGEASDRSEAIDLAEALKPDVALLDAEMYDLDVLETARALRLRSPMMAVVIHALNPDTIARAPDCHISVVGKYEGAVALLMAIRAAGEKNCQCQQIS